MITLQNSPSTTMPGPTLTPVLEAQVQDSFSPDDSGSLSSVMAAAKALEQICTDGCSVYRNGLRFEHSGDSMAVYDGQFRIDRVNLGDCSDTVFLIAIDTWLLNRYMAEVA